MAKKRLINARLIISTEPCLFGDVHVYESVLSEQQGIKVLKIANTLSNILHVIIGGVIRV